MNTGVVVIGVSAGGFHALHAVLKPLPSDFSLPIAVVQHRRDETDDYLVRSLDEQCNLVVKCQENGEKPRPGVIYIGPPSYHSRFTHGPCFMLSDDAPVNYSRPSIDVLFLSAAEVYGAGAVGVVLTGANHDSAKGLRKIKERGGIAIVQDPDTAKVDIMPRADIAATEIDHIIRLHKIGPILWDIERERRKGLIEGDV